MKTTLVIQDGVNQIVLTPESDYEKNILNLVNSKNVETTIKVGNFTDCQGGWIRYYEYRPCAFDRERIDSLMLVLRDKN